MKEMDSFEVDFAKALSSEVVPMNELLDYVSATRGKRLRPTLVYLLARLFGEVNETTRRTALFVEMLHTATLIHDDVVDGSVCRRGKASVNARWDNASAVLAGDYLLAKAMRLLSSPDERLILQEMLDVVMAMSEGELIQNALSKREYGEQQYLDIIERKTARLIKACCVGGALSVAPSGSPLPTPHYSLISDFGLNLGLAFQIRDDILDDDNPEVTALAERLLPVYTEKASRALEALRPYVRHEEVLASLRELTTFCVERNL